jgi:hypothetical protein
MLHLYIFNFVVQCVFFVKKLINSISICCTSNFFFVLSNTIVRGEPNINPLFELELPMKNIQKKIKLSIAIILASLFFQNCTAWPALTALLALAGGDKGGALLLVPPGGGGGGGDAAGATGEAGAGETIPNAPSNLSVPAPAGPFTQGVAITPITPTFEGTVTNCETTTPLPAGLTINSTTCVISGTPTEEVAETTYTIVASNSGGSTSATVTMTVNAGPPAISFPGSPFSITINTTANIIPSNQGGAITSCAINTALPTGLSFNTTTCAITGTATALSGATNYTITPTGAMGAGNPIIISIAVVDVAPTSLTASTIGAIQQNVAITPINFTFGGGGTLTSCSVDPALPAGLSLNTTTCEISGTPTGTADSTTYNITATNSGGSTTTSITFAVTPQAPTISYTGSPYVYALNTTITNITPTFGGGTRTSCSISPNLNTLTGLSFDTSTCVISGTTSSASISTDYTITANGLGGSSSTTTINISVIIPPTGMTASNSGPLIYYVGQTINPNLTYTVSGGAITSCTLVAPGPLTLPTGMSLVRTNDTTCTISGTPSVQAANATYTVRATNSAGHTQATTQFRVDPAPTLSYAGTPFTFTQGTSVGTVNATIGGGTPTTCSSSPALPAGLSISATTCAITGTPTVFLINPTNFTITAGNPAGSVDSTISIQINPMAPTGLTANGGTTFSYTQGTAITPITFSVDPDRYISNCVSDPALPAGLTINTATCEISGTPTVAIDPAQTYNITASNTAGNSNTVALTIGVTAPPPSALSFGTIPTEFTAGFAISSITPTYTGTVTSCSSSPPLSAGLTLSDTCVLSGTPTTPTGSATYTITATGPGGSTDTTITFAVVAAPTVQFASGTSNSTNEESGNRTITLTLSAASQQTVTILVRDLGTGTATAGQDYTSIGTALTVTFNPAETSKTFNQPIIDDAIFEGNETINLEIYSPNFATLGAQTTHAFTIIDDEIGVTAAWTLDCNSNGRIDHYRLELNQNVNDSTFPGYVFNGLGTVTDKWFVSGRSNVRLHHGTALNTACSGYGFTDSANDNVIFLTFDEGASSDTAAKPDITTTSDQDLVGTNTFWKMSQIFTASVTEADRAAPVIVNATASTGSNVLTVVFSEDVYTVEGAPACGAGGNLVVGDFVYYNDNPGGATSINTMGADTCAVDDRTVTLIMDSNFVNDDNATDKIAASGFVYDVANNQGKPDQIGARRPLSISSNAPTITSIEQFDVDRNGKIDQIKITFSQAMSDSTIANADAAQFKIGGYDGVRVDSVTGGAGGGTISSPNNDPGVADDNVVTVFTDNFTLNGTGLKAMSFVEASGRWMAGAFMLASVADLSAVVQDKAPPVILTAVAVPVNGDPGIQSGDQIVLTFSETTDKSITTANIATALTISGGKAWGPLSSAVWNGPGDVLTVTFSGDPASTIAVGDTITIANTLRDETANNTAVNIPALGPITGSFGIDTTKPYVLYASDITATTLLVQFSEPMFQLANQADCGAHADTAKAFNCLVNYTLAEDPSDAGYTDPVMGSLVVVSPSSIRITLTNTFFNIRYRITVATSVTDQATTPNTMGSPNSISFIGLEPLRVVTAQSVSTNQIRVTFNKPAKGGMNDTGSAECNNTTECGKRYKISPLPLSASEPSIFTNATLAGDSSSVVLTHNGTQGGVAYTVMAANGRTGDGFDNVSSDWIEGVTGGDNKMQAFPFDRGTFIGSGVACDTLACGPFFDDPFQDGSTFSFAFEYDNKVYLGTNDKNNGAVRFEANGANSIGVGFRFINNSALSLSCAATNGFGFILSNTLANATCGTGNSGPNAEVGAVSFTAVTLTDASSNNYEVLMTGVLKYNSIDRVYYTQDKDTTLAMRNVGLAQANGVNTNSTTNVYGTGNGVYAFVASAHNSAPQGTSYTATFSSGVVTIGTTTGMGLQLWPGIGKSGSPSNPNGDVVGIDMVKQIDTTIYLANNGGVVRVTRDKMLSGKTLTPSNSSQVGTYYGPVVVTPTHADFTGTSLYLPTTNSITGGGLGKLRPGEKAYPFIVKFQGDLYLARNVATGANSTNLRGELWRCTPNGAGECAAADWTRIITGSETRVVSSNEQELGTTHKAISMLTTNGSNTLYVGFDGDDVRGARIFRFRSSGGTKPGVVAGNPTLLSRGWEPQGAFGMGSGSNFVINSMTIFDATSNRHYLYAIIGDGINTSSIKVVRQFDIN